MSGTVACPYCGRPFVVPAQVMPVAPIQQVYPVAYDDQQIVTSDSSPFAVDTSSPTSMWVKLEGMYNGRYLINSKNVLLKFTATTVDVNTHSLNIAVGIVLLFVIIVGGLAIAIPFAMWLGVGNGNAVDNLVGTVRFKLIAPALLAVIIPVVFFLIKICGRSIDITLNRNLITEVTAISKLALAAGDAGVRIKFRGGHFLVTVPDNKKKQLYRFIADATGVRVK